MLCSQHCFVLFVVAGVYFVLILNPSYTGHWPQEVDLLKTVFSLYLWWYLHSLHLYYFLKNSEYNVQSSSNSVTLLLYLLLYYIQNLLTYYYVVEYRRAIPIYLSMWNKLHIICTENTYNYINTLPPPQPILSYKSLSYKILISIYTFHYYSI